MTYGAVASITVSVVISLSIVRSVACPTLYDVVRPAGKPSRSRNARIVNNRTVTNSVRSG